MARFICLAGPLNMVGGKCRAKNLSGINEPITDAFVIILSSSMDRLLVDITVFDLMRDSFLR